MTKKLPIIGAQDSEICTKCGGVCCQGTPGASDPMDLLDEDGDLDELAIFEMLSSGDWVLAFWDGDPRGGRRELGPGWVSVVYYPHPAYKKKTGELIERRYSWNLDGCIFLTDKGCKLEFETRPYGCRSLVPHWDEVKSAPTCKHLNEDLTDNRRAALNWLPYQEKLMAIAKEVEPKGFW